MSDHVESSENWGTATDEATRISIKPFITKDNKSFYIWVVIFLGIATISTIIGSIWLAIVGKTIPNALVAIGSVAVGALGSIFNTNSARR